MEEASNPQKSSISTFGDEEPRETSEQERFFRVVVRVFTFRWLFAGKVDIMYLFRVMQYTRNRQAYKEQKRG